jgi:hypothetical protein
MRGGANRVQTSCQGSKVEGWLRPNPHPLVRGPSDHTTAIVIKRKSTGTGRINIIFNDRYVDSYDTRPDAEESVVMVFLKPQYYCWWMGDAAVKYIRRSDGTV